MAPKRARDPTSPVAKRRRTFFSSNLLFPPNIAATNKPASTPTARVLAALDSTVYPRRAPGRGPRLRKLRKNDLVDPTPSSPPESMKAPRVSRITRPHRSSTTHKTCSTSSADLKLPAFVSTRRADATFRVAEAQTAQSTNSKLSEVMEIAMRSSISGREQPCMRDQTWTFMGVQPDKNIEKAAESEASPRKKKKCMAAGLDCQNANAKSPRNSVSKVLKRHDISNEAPSKGGTVVRPRRTVAQASSSFDQTFPPLPYDDGYRHFSGQEHDFVLPFDISSGVENDSLAGIKKPMTFQRIRRSKLLKVRRSSK